MRSKLGPIPLQVILAVGLATALAQSCGEKKAPSAETGSSSGGGSGCKGSAKLKACSDDDDSGTTSGTGTKPRTGTSTGSSGTATSDQHIGDDDDSSADTFDLCKVAKADGKVGASPLIGKICPDVAALRGKAFDGTNNKVAPSVVQSGSNLNVDSTAGSLVPAAVDDYYKMMRMQVNDAKVFKTAFANYDHNAVVEDLTNAGDEPKYHYTNTDGDGAVSYSAQSHFVTLKAGVAYAQITEQTTTDPAVTERMMKLQALVILEKKDATHTYVYTTTIQQYTEPGGASNAATLKTRVHESLIAEQGYAFENAKVAKEKAK